MISTSRLDILEGYLTFCEGVISSTGTPVIKKNTSNTDKKITNEKKNGTRKQQKCVFCAQCNSRRVIDGSPMSNQ